MGNHRLGLSRRLPTATLVKKDSRLGLLCEALRSLAKQREPGYLNSRLGESGYLNSRLGEPGYLP